ncbi:MAG: cbb3-type cytochrome c oxidase subunit 3 [Pseudomonadota bacterium]
MTYELAREIAGSWMLLFMFCFFLGVVLWAFRPGSRAQHRDTANVIFRNEDAPAGAADESRKEART